MRPPRSSSEVSVLPGRLIQELLTGEGAVLSSASGGTSHHCFKRNSREKEENLRAH